jgi:hypothetical protein
LSTELRRGPLDLTDTVLAGLTVATGLDRYVFSESHAAARVADLVAGLPPPLQELIAHTQAVVGQAVLTYRS